jgi:D-3-phosphoglycerate dehydrogenase / 2-oxoglutarate reductase
LAEPTAGRSQKVKILIADKFQQGGIDELKAMGATVAYDPDVTPETLPASVEREDPDVLVVRSTKVKPPVFDAAKRLTLVVRAGAGVDNIDVPAASARGISVANCPGKNSIAVAELVWGLILSCDRRIPDQTADLRAGRWNKKEYSRARGLHGRTLGVIGVGQIAREVITRARAFGMDVIAWSRSLSDATAQELSIERRASPIEIAREADVITVNVAATSETKQLVDAGFCQAMKPGAVLINTSRGTVVDEKAMLQAIREKEVRAGLDVFEGEPVSASGEFNSELASSPGVFGTHHIGASTDQAQDAIAAEAVRIIRVYKERGEVPNIVNRCAKSPATRLLVVRHLNRPGVLALVIGEIGKANINIEEMENVIYQGAEAACAKIRLDAEPPEAVMQKIRDGSKNVLSVDLTAIE